MRSNRSPRPALPAGRPSVARVTLSLVVCRLSLSHPLVEHSIMDECGTGRPTVAGRSGVGHLPSPSISRAVATAVVVDIQCFHDNANEFVVKEASVMDLTTGAILLHGIAEPPYSINYLTAAKRRECFWLTQCHHGLEWNQGDMPYYLLLDKLRTLLTNRTLIYVKGAEKKAYIEKYLLSTPANSNVVDMVEIGCVPLVNLLPESTNAVRCDQHNTNAHRCALATCSLLRSWIHNPRSECPLNTHTMYTSTV